MRLILSGAAAVALSACTPTPDKYTVVFKADRPRPLAFDCFEFLNIAEPASANDPT